METLSAFSLPPGFGFHPTDVELVSHYLRRKILGLKIDFEVIPEVDIYKHEPWDLPAKCHVPTRDSKWHFFTSCDKKYPTGSRSNRATEAGYWKSTGKDRNIRSNNRVIGTKKTLVFHEGRPPCGKRTEWIMHEYYTFENECKAVPDGKGSYVLCRVTKRLSEGENVYPQTDDVDHCEKQPKDMTAAVTPKESPPSENVEDIQKWFTELFDPNFPPISSLTEVKTEPKISQAGRGTLALKQEVLDSCFLPEVPEDSYLLPPGENLYSMLQSAYQNFDDAYGDFDIGSLDPLGDSYTLTENHHDGFFQVNNDMEIASAYAANNNNHDTEIQLRQRRAKPVTSMSQQRIKLQVSKMETRNAKSLSKTIEIVDKGVHLDSCNENQLNVHPKTLSDASRAITTARTPNWGQKPVRPLRNSGGMSWFLGVTGLPNFLGWCSSATTNCFFLSACMMGTGALISYFILRDAWHFTGSFSAVELQ